MGSRFKSDDNELVIIRGLPGSGKTTLALQYKRDGYVHLEPDMFLYENGVYRYDAEYAKVAHACVRKLTYSMLREGYNVVVSSTLPEYGAVEQYLSITRKLRKRVRMIRMTHDFGNIHGAPESVIDDMRRKMAVPFPEIRDFEGNLVVESVNVRP